ncbi:MAG: ABC transporter permease, partial [Candidatus Hodarchaeota archaeon]
GTVLLVVSTVLVFIYSYFVRKSEQFVTVTGKGWRPRIHDLGRGKYLTLIFCLGYFVIAVILPIAVLFEFAFTDLSGQFTLQNFADTIASASNQKAFSNSIFLALVGAGLCMLLMTLVGYITTKTKVRGRKILEVFAFMPFSFPGIVLAIGLLWVYARVPILYGTIWLLMLGYITRFMPYGLRNVTSTVIQIHPDLEGQSRICGGSWFKTLKSIILPLLKPGILSGYIYLAIIFLRELSVSVLLYTGNTVVFSVQLWNMMQSSRFEEVAALGLLMTIVSTTLAAILVKIRGLGRR